MQNIVKDWRMQGYKIAVFGVVQGVGFRPFVCVLARRFGLKGYVKNLGNNVEIVLQIPLQTKRIQKIPRSSIATQDSPPKIPAIIARFAALLQKNAPAPARIHKITLEAFESVESSEVFLDFSILESAQSSQNLAKGALPNDVAICESCRRDLRNPRDRRYFYAFVNCVACGPRYTIISALPFDRAHTAMRGFRMCESCQGEYEDSRDRRFHAQSVSCPRCGISVALFDRFGALVAGGKIAAQSAQSAESSQFAAIKSAQKLINRGEILAFKGVGGFNLIAKVDFDAIVRLRVRKNRPKKPFAIMFRDLAHLRRYFEPSREEIAALTAPAAPIVLLSKRTLKRPLPPNLAPNMPTVGVILAYSPLHLLLFYAQKSPLIFTSANLSGEPIITAKNAVFTKLGGVFDYLFDFEREILNPIDDSLCAILANGKPLLLRAARGFYPLNLSLNLGANLKNATLKNRQKPAIIALGAHQKSQIALFCEDSLIISPFIGDLEGLESAELFAKTIEFFLKIYDLKPEIVLTDAHPQYFSSRFAPELAARFGARVGRIFHHRAHFYAAMLEAGLLDSPRKILGVIFDGTGLGEDGAIWGGEFFVRESGGQCKNGRQKSRVRRILHFKYFPIIGALSEERDNKKIAVGILQSVVGSEVLGFIRGAQNYLQIFQKNLNCHQSSSVGRIFDFVAFFCGLEKQSFEGESGLFLENLYDESVAGAYDFKIVGEEIALDSMFVAIAKESLGGALGGESSGDAAVNLGAESWADSADSQDLQDSPDSPRGESVGRDLGGEKIREIHKIRAQIASKFFNTLVKIITQVALREGAAVVFSGGVFQNKTLCNAIIRAFEREKIEFYMHEKLPPNDGNIAAGQITAFLFDS